MRWQSHQLDHIQITWTLLQTDNHASTLSLSFLQADALPDAQPTVLKNWSQCMIQNDLFVFFVRLIIALWCSFHNLCIPVICISAVQRWYVSKCEYVCMGLSLLKVHVIQQCISVHCYCNGTINSRTVINIVLSTAFFRQSHPQPLLCQPKLGLFMCALLPPYHYSSVTQTACSKPGKQTGLCSARTNAHYTMLWSVTHPHAALFTTCFATHQLLYETIRSSPPTGAHSRVVDSFTSLCQD